MAVAISAMARLRTAAQAVRGKSCAPASMLQRDPDSAKAQARSTGWTTKAKNAMKQVELNREC